MAMSCNKNQGTFLYEKPAYAGSITARIATDMSHDYPCSPGLEFEQFGTHSPNHTGISVSGHSPDPGTDSHEAAQSIVIADVAGVPYLVAVAEMGYEAIVPTTMGVREDSYFHLH